VFGMRGVVLFQSCDFERAEDAGGVSHMGGEGNEVSVGRTDIYTRVPAI